MAGREWSVLVAEGREAVQRESDALWRLGDLALEVEPAGIRGVPTGSKARLQKYANEIGLAANTLLSYRLIADRWPAKQRSNDATASAHRELAHNPDRFKIMRELEARAKARGRRVTVADARLANGKLVLQRKVVDVSDHTRRLPGTVDPSEDGPWTASTIVELKSLRRPLGRRRFLVSLPINELSAWIDEAWRVLEEREGSRAA